METHLPIAEQLDRAAVELRLDHPILNRLALILVDNAIELMLRRTIWVNVAFGGEVRGLTAKQRKQSRSQKFADRLAVLVHLDEISPLEDAFVVAAHSYRNTAYHEGDAEEAFLRALCFAYYRFACGYFARFTMGFYGWSTRFRFTDIGRRYYERSRTEEGILGKIDRQSLPTSC